MRTTLNIDADVLNAAKRLARKQQKTLDQVVSELTGRALGRALRDTSEPEQPTGRDAGLGFRPFPSRGGVVTNELIDRLRGEIGDW